MFVQLFKLTTAATLIALLIFLINQRDLYIVTQQKASLLYARIINTKNSQLLSHQEPTPVKVVDTPAMETVSPVSLTPQTPKMSPSQQEVTSVTPYVALTRGVSDTDESYRPKVSPCKKSMGYKIGAFDSRFGITAEQFIKTVDTSSSIWEEAVGKKLFYYDLQGPLTINLIYDERQEKTEKINDLALEIENSKDVAESLKRTQEQEKALYLASGEKLMRDNEAYQVKYKAYAAKVDTYNTQGGAPKGEYEAMMLELEQLQQGAKDLEMRRDDLLATMDSINKKVVRYNELVAYINGLIKKSNTLGAAEFTEGRFVPRTNTVDIFQYNDSNKLLRVMTHELGHVLGINHNDNRYSIMYSFNSATTTTLSDEDREELVLLCAQ